MRVTSLWPWLVVEGLVSYGPSLGYTLHVPAEVSAALAVFCPLLATCVLGVWSWRIIRTQHIELGALMGHAPARWRPWGSALLGLIAVAIVGHGTGTITILLLRRLSPGPSVIPVIGSASAFATVLRWCDVVLLTPIVEETVFRGIVLHRWAQKWGFTKGILASAILFGLMHADVVGTTFFGLVMTVLYVRTRTLWVPIVCHALFNAGAMTAAAIRLPGDTTLLATILVSGERMWPAVLGLSALVAYAGGTFVARDLATRQLPYFANSVRTSRG